MCCCFLIMLALFQAEVLGGAILQQTFVVEYTVAYQMCIDCHRVEAKVGIFTTGIRVIPQGTVDNNLGPDRLAGPKALDPNYCRQATL